MRWRELAHRWFVEYNPLYFASALSVLAGIYLVAHGLPSDDFASKAAVAGVTEAYQLLLVGGAWLLRRRGLPRPAALLGLVALVFVLDVAFTSERLFSHARTMSLAPGMRAREAIPASLMLAFAGPFKLWLLARVFRLRGTGTALALSGAALLLVPLLPYAVEASGPGEGARQAAHLFATWLGAPLLGWAMTRRAWTPGEDEGVRALRIARLAPFVVLALFLVHASAWSSFPGLGLTPAHAAPYLLAAFLVLAERGAGRRPRAAELSAWVGGAASLLACLGAPPATGLWPVAGMALLAGASMLVLVKRAGLRLLLPALVCAFGGIYALGSGAATPLPPPGAAWPFALCLALLSAAAGQRDFRCLVASSAAAGAAVLGLEPAPGLVPYAAVAGAAWLGVWSWPLFPELRRWLPGAAATGALTVGAVLLWREPGVTAPWFGAASLLAACLGSALRVRSLQAIGLAGAALLAVATRSHYAPSSALGWGVVLLFLGFLLLAAGIALNLRGGRRSGRGQAAEVGSGGQIQITET